MRREPRVRLLHDAREDVLDLEHAPLGLAGGVANEGMNVTIAPRDRAASSHHDAARPGGAARRASIGLAAGLALIVAAPAAAQSSDPDGEARAAFEAGAHAYDEGRYDEAVEHFQRSYELSERPALLYNIATAAERARQDELALRTYEEYLERVPDGDLRTRVETRIVALRRMMEASADRAAERPAPAGPDIAPWIVVGAGAALAITGAVLLGVGLSDRAAVEDPPAGAMWFDGANGAYERGPALLTSGIVVLPVGVLLAAAGVVWAVVAPGPSNERVSLRIGPGTVQLTGEL